MPALSLFHSIDTPARDLDDRSRSATIAPCVAQLLGTPLKSPWPAIAGKRLTTHPASKSDRADGGVSAPLWPSENSISLKSLLGGCEKKVYFFPLSLGFAEDQ